MKLFMRYVKKFRWLLFGTFILGAISDGLYLLDPQIFRLLVDNYARHVSDLTRQEFLSGILGLSAVGIAIALVARVMQNIQEFNLTVVTQRIGAELYAKSVKHALSLPFAVYEDQRSGELLQKLQKARTDMQTFISGMMGVVFSSAINVTFVVIYAFSRSWLLGVTYLSIIPTITLVTALLNRRIKKAQAVIVRELADLAGSTTETLRNVELVKSLSLEEQEISRLNNVNARILGLEINKARLVRTLSFLQDTLINIIRSLLVLLMLWLVYRDGLTVGELFSFFAYTFYIFYPLAQLNRIFVQYQEARASNEAVEKILSMPVEPKPVNAVTVGPLESVTFDTVDFTYQSAEMPSVKDISLTVGAGETVAFVGPSGSGKSTLIKLIVGLYKPTRGALKVNGTPATQINRAELAQRVGLVTQETQLFAGTIRENLLFVRQNASDEDMKRALDEAAAMSIIERGDKGLDTKIGEGGLKLSGGERQRLAIARALLRDPSLIIFDEATSSLDSITEHAITRTIQGLEQTMGKRRGTKAGAPITILVAHRLSTIAHAKRIYVLEHGKISESGSHKELLAKQGLYSALWREQQASAQEIPAVEKP